MWSPATTDSQLGEPRRRALSVPALFAHQIEGSNLPSLGRVSLVLLRRRFVLGHEEGGRCIVVGCPFCPGGTLFGFLRRRREEGCNRILCDRG